MNVIGAGVVDGVALESVKADLRGVITTGAVPVSVTVHHVTGSTQNVAAGTRTDTETADAVTGWLTPQTLTAEDGWQPGDRLLALFADDLTTSPDTAVRVTVGGDVWRVLAVKSGAFGAHHKLHIRRAS